MRLYHAIWILALNYRLRGEIESLDDCVACLDILFLHKLLHLLVF